jgi:hypothetical protein
LAARASDDEFHFIRRDDLGVQAAEGELAKAVVTGSLVFGLVVNSLVRELLGPLGNYLGFASG